MIKAVIFDCYGVLCTDGLKPFQKKYLKNQSVIDLADKYLVKVDKGQILRTNFLDLLVKESGLSYTEVEKLIHNNVPDEELFTYIREKLLGKYKLAILSNVSQYFLNDIFTKEQIGIFDEISLSFESGFVKPEPQAYLNLVKKLGVKENECLFIDDQERYCDAATKLGIRSIIYRDFDSYKVQIDKILSSKQQG